MQYDEHQERAIKNICALDRKISVLAGSAGRGKTTILSEILKRLWESKINPSETYIAAPTGKAAVVINNAMESSGLLDKFNFINSAKTIHRTLGCMGSSWLYNENNKLTCSLFVIDEASMVDVEILARVIRSISDDARIILVLDNKQLLPVGPGSPAIDIIRADIKGQVNVLKTNYRQKNGELLGAGLESILSGNVPKFHCNETPGNIFFHEADDKCDIPRKIHDIVKDWYGKDDWIALSPQWGGEAGINSINDYLKKMLNEGSDKKNHFDLYGKKIHQGDMVRHTKNNYDLNVFNGFCGIIDDIENSIVTVRYFNDTVKYIEQTDKNQLSLGYCISIHASQGSQYEKVCLVIHSTHSYQLCKSLLYVGCSRAQKELHIVGDQKGLQRAIKKDINDSRNTYLSLYL